MRGRLSSTFVKRENRLDFTFFRRDGRIAVGAFDGEGTDPVDFFRGERGATVGAEARGLMDERSLARLRGRGGGGSGEWDVTPDGAAHRVRSADPMPHSIEDDTHPNESADHGDDENVEKDRAHVEVEEILLEEGEEAPEGAANHNDRTDDRGETRVIF